MRVLRLTTEDAKTWSQVGDRAIFVSDLVDQARRVRKCVHAARRYS
jgi:hypothetical protein